MASLLARRLLVFTGKGGTGKSIVAAAVASLAARRGMRVLAAETNARDRIGPLLGAAVALAPKDEKGAGIHPLTERVSVVNLRADAALFEYGVMKLRSRRVARGLLGNRVVQRLLRVIPSIAEVAILGKLLHHVREKISGRYRFDLVVFDAPATGHGISLLQLPQVVLASVPAGPLREDMLWMNALLVDPAITAVNLVARPEELPVNETLELNARLRDEVKVPRGACFLDGVWPSRLDAPQLDELRAADERVGEVASQMQGLADESAAQETRLRAGLDVPVLPLPQLFEDQPADGSREHVLVERLAELLAESPGGARAAGTGT
jgi:anion-transporting  ArsA/GET3 family ATPase